MKLEQIKLINGIHEWLWNRINARSAFINSTMRTSDNDIVNWDSLSTAVEIREDLPFVLESPARSYKPFANVSLMKEGSPRFTFSIVKYYRRTSEPTELWTLHPEHCCIQFVDNYNDCNTLDVVIFNMSNDGTLNIEKCDEIEGCNDKLDAFIDTLIKSMKRLFDDDKTETSQCTIQGIRTISTFDTQTYPVGSFIEVTLDHGPLCYCDDENGDGAYWSIGHTYRCIIANYLNCGTHMVTQATSNVFGVREIGIEAQDVADGKIKINLIL